MSRSSTKKNAEETSALKSMLIKLSETCDILEREIQDGKVSLQLEVHNFGEEFRSFCSQQTSCSTCNHVYNDGPAESRKQESNQAQATTIDNINDISKAQDFTFHSTDRIIFCSEMLMVMDKINRLNSCLAIVTTNE